MVNGLVVWICDLVLLVFIDIGKEEILEIFFIVFWIEFVEGLGLGGMWCCLYDWDVFGIDVVYL